MNLVTLGELEKYPSIFAIRLFGTKNFFILNCPEEIIGVMQNSVATIKCSNVNCQASNPQENRFCHDCGTPIVKRYLRALGDWIRSYQVGELIDDRYLLKNENDKILLDTQPGIPPKLTANVPKKLRPYLKLFPYRLHVPQVYSYYFLTLGKSEEEIQGEETEIMEPEKAEIQREETEIIEPEKAEIEICLLEYSGVPLDCEGKLIYPNLLPTLSEAWSKASPLRQLNWLWQIIKLWQPLESQHRVSSLLNPNLIRVNGGIIQILELNQDLHHYYSIKQLGKHWSSLAQTASPLIANFLQELCHRLQKGKIPHPDYLLNYLEPAIAQCGQWYQYNTQIFASTDPGPQRDHNEDTCYPPSGELIEGQKTTPSFALVCDGIGGQDGGEIASALAKDILVEQMPKLSLLIDEGNYQQYLEQLKQAINLANDHISDRNDSEKRQQLERMGTTMVMGLFQGHEIYLANVGDSRIYQITPTSCYQVTVDDDLASREVTLAYLFYREAIKYPNAGALIQALGMANSKSLEINLNRLIIDEDSIFLLCSDGLSDYDRVEQYSNSEIAPILRGETDIKTVGQRLIELANEKNGHDNVTIALVSVQVQSITDDQLTPLSIAAIEQVTSNRVQLSVPKTEEPPTQVPTTEPILPLDEPLLTPRTKLISSPILLWLSVTVLGLLTIVGIVYLTGQFSDPDNTEVIEN